MPQTNQQYLHNAILVPSEMTLKMMVMASLGSPSDSVRIVSKPKNGQISVSSLSIEMINSVKAFVVALLNVNTY